ncbi:MAG: OmpA family protein [Planctomycetota bacterium]|nr:OmpA family protein [Planctomycetota bacterium]
MSIRYLWASVILALVAVSGGGCTQGQFGLANNPNPFTQNQLGNNLGGNQPNQSLASTVDQLNSKLSNFDSSNQELHTEVAQLKRQLAVSEDEKDWLKRQMGDTLQRYKDLLSAKQEVDGRLTAIQTTTKTQTGAEIRANNSLLGKLDELNLNGIEAVEDGDTIRVYLPSDRLFDSGTYQLKTTGQAMLDQVATEIKRHFPRQIVGVEGHIDAINLMGNQSLHQVSATQALAVFEYYRKTNSVSEKQMFLLGHGANRPRYSNVNPQARVGNRRIEIVIYPETI